MAIPERFDFALGQTWGQGQRGSRSVCCVWLVLEPPQMRRVGGWRIGCVGCGGRIYNRKTFARSPLLPQAARMASPPW